MQNAQHKNQCEQLINNDLDECELEIFVNWNGAKVTVILRLGAILRESVPKFNGYRTYRKRKKSNKSLLLIQHLYLCCVK